LSKDIHYKFSPTAVLKELFTTQTDTAMPTGTALAPYLQELTDINKQVWKFTIASL